jgi:hypothetical protein
MTDYILNISVDKLKPNPLNMLNKYSLKNSLEKSGNK